MSVEDLWANADRADAEKKIADISAERDKYREALERIATPESWFCPGCGAETIARESLGNKTENQVGGSE